MNVMRMNLCVAFACAIFAGLTASISADDAQLDRAKELYRSAAYDEALGVLDSIRAAAPSTETLEASEYRVFCLVALDRKDEARNAIAALISANPFYELSEAQASPRVRAVFSEVRKSLLPSLVQSAYTQAKAAFDRKDPEAAAAFERVLTLLRDPDVSSNTDLADLAVVAAAFRDLSAARELAAAAPPPPAPSARDTSSPGESAAGKPAEPPVYRDGAVNLVPPVVVSQTLPTSHLAERRLWTGAIEVLIDETGKVLSARMAMPVQPTYDRQLLQAALNWKYRPATKDGVPARYIKIINVRLDTRPDCTMLVTQQCRPAGGN
jgi:tetratricopeptide (TPR) repeat protein